MKMKWFRNESGQVLVITLFSMAVLIGGLGLATDVGVLYHARRHMQTAADAAAMAGATEMFYNGSANVAAKAYAAATANGVDNTVTGNNVIVTLSPTLPGAASACPSCVEVQLSTPNPTIFIQTLSSLFFQSNNFSTVNVSAKAIAGAPGASQTCMWVMDPTDPSTLWIHGAGDINAPNCGIYVNSNNSGALCVTGSAGKSNFSRVSVVGGQGTKGNCKGDPGPPVYTNAGVQSPPVLTNLPTDPTTNCPSVTNVATLTGTITGPGYGNYACYSNGPTTGSTPVTLSSVTMGPGIYVFETGVKITGATTIGTNAATGGATVVVTGKGAYDSGTATTFYDYAPTSGTYNGVAIYQPYNSTTNQDNQPMTLQFGSGSSIFDGSVVAPGADVTLHDQGGAVNATTLVVGEIYVNGTVNLTNYSTYNPITTPFKQITLVE